MTTWCIYVSITRIAFPLSALSEELCKDEGGIGASEAE